MILALSTVYLLSHLIYYNKKRVKNILFTSVKKDGEAKSVGFARHKNNAKDIKMNGLTFYGYTKTLH